MNAVHQTGSRLTCSSVRWLAWLAGSPNGVPTRASTLRGNLSPYHRFVGTSDLS